MALHTQPEHPFLPFQPDDFHLKPDRVADAVQDGVHQIGLSVLTEVDAHDASIICHADQDGATLRVGEGAQCGEYPVYGRKGLLELQPVSLLCLNKLLEFLEIHLSDGHTITFSY